MDTSYELIDAFADGERVNGEALKAALAESAARDYLVDLLALRALVQDHVSLDAPAAAPVAASPRSTTATWLRAIAAIAIVGVAASAGFVAGHRTHDAPAPAGTTAIVAPASIDVVAAPEPTRVIRFEAGVDWREHSGGH